MKIALVHELLTIRGGAERVLRILADMFPEAPIYTLLYNEKKLGDWFPKERVRAAKRPFPLSRFPLNHHLYLRHFPKMVEQWNFTDFDLVLSTSSAFVHGLITPETTKHISYINAPARYLWDRTFDVQARAGGGLLGPLKQAYLRRVFHKLRTWDASVADRPDVLLAASQAVQRRIELYWRRESEVVYPPIDDFWLEKQDEESEMKHAESYLIASTLVPYKLNELAVIACTKTNRPLTIVGEGPDRKRLEKLAGPTVEFLGYQPRDNLRALMTQARAVIMPGNEDFGLVPVEAMACGTPVIACSQGGAKETVLDGQTGVLFPEPTVEAITSALDRFEQLTFAPDVCQKQADAFSRPQFEAGIRAAIEACA